MISTYAQLKQAILSYGKRSDVLSHLDEFIAATEQHMTANPDAILRIREMEQTYTTTLGASATGDSVWTTGFWTPGFWVDGFWGSAIEASRFVDLPQGFIEFRRVALNTGGRDIYLENKTPFNMRYKTGSGIPTAFTVTDVLELDIVPGGDYTLSLKYIGDVLPLSATNTTNVVLTNFQTIYLYGCLHALNIWARNEAAADYYYRLFIGAITGANRKTRRGRHGPAMKMTAIGSTP